jgi:hypothetical protein
MGIYGSIRRATVADAERLRADERLLEAFLFGEPPIVVEERLPGLLGFLLRLTPIKVQRTEPAPPSANPLWPPAAPGEELDLEKAWHGLHFLLTGMADGGTEPACFLLDGGEELSGDDEDVHARLLRPPQVRAFADHLAAITTDELTRRFDPVRMTKLRIYPEIWQRPASEDEPRGYLLGAFAELRDFVGTAAAAGDALVVCIA